MQPVNEHIAARISGAGRVLDVDVPRAGSYVRDTNTATGVIYRQVAGVTC